MGCQGKFWGSHWESSGKVWEVQRVSRSSGEVSLPSRDTPILSPIHNPKGPKIEKMQSRLKFTTRLKFSISLEIFNPGPSEFPTKKIGVWWVARLKISISIEKDKSRRAILNFFNLWALREISRRDSRGIKRDKLEGTNGAKFAIFFADFR